LNLPGEMKQGASNQAPHRKQYYQRKVDRRSQGTKDACNQWTEQSDRYQCGRNWIALCGFELFLFIARRLSHKGNL